MLSVAAHGHEPGAEHIALAALSAVRDLDSDRHLLYPDFIFALLGQVARTALEQLMRIPNYEYQSDSRFGLIQASVQAFGLEWQKCQGLCQALLAPLGRGRFQRCHGLG